MSTKNIDTLTLKVKVTGVEKATKDLEQLTVRFQELAKIDLSGLSTATSSLSTFANVSKSASKGIEKVGDALTGSLDGLAEKEATIDSASASAEKLNKVLGDTAKKVEKLNSTLGRFAKKLANIMIYRSIRDMISKIKTAFDTGLKNAYFFANEFIQVLSQPLDLLKTNVMWFTNQIGATSLAVKKIISDLVESLSNQIMSLLTLFTKFFSALGGNKTYLQAKKNADVYADSLRGVKKAQLQLLGFDEINNITDKGSGTSSAEDFSKLFEVQQMSTEEFDRFRGIASAIASILGTIVATLTVGKIGEIVSHIGLVLGNMPPNMVKILKPLGLITGDATLMVGKLALIIAAIGVIAYAFTDLYNNNEDFRNQVDNFLQIIKDVLSNVGRIIKAIWDIAKPFIGLLVEAVKIVLPIIVRILEVVGGIVDFVLTLAGDLLTGLASGISYVADFIGDNFKNVKDKVVEWFGEAKDFILELPDKISEGFKKAIDKIKGWFNDLFGGITSSKLFTTISNVFGGSKLQTPKAYATGGAISSGQLFIANETAPELVGNIGNTSAVMNNSQIVEAVSNGVRNAILSANGGGQNITLNVDGQALFDIIVNRNNSTVRQTGMTPLMV